MCLITSLLKVSNVNVHRHHARSQCKFHIRASRTIYVDKSVKYRGTLLWNQLRDNVKNWPNFNIFKKQLVYFFYVVHECHLYVVIVHICVTCRAVC